MATKQLGKRTFTMERDLIEVTSIHRPDERWEYTDPAGHVHRWEWPDGRRVYQPGEQATVPTVRWIVDEIRYYPDGEPYEAGHHECVMCGAHVAPSFTADTSRQYMPGLAYYAIDGRSVSPEEFQHELLVEQNRAAGGHSVDAP